MGADVFGNPRDSGEPLLRAENVVKHFPLTQGIVFKRQIGSVRAVDGVSFDLRRGETLGVVGESGCGKSTLAKTLLRLEEPTGGHAYYKGEDIFSMSKGRLRGLRRDLQIIFQDPYASLNPRMTVGDIITEAWDIHYKFAKNQQRLEQAGEVLERSGVSSDKVEQELKRRGAGVATADGNGAQAGNGRMTGAMVEKKDRTELARNLLERVGLPRDAINRYPHQFSGGQRQRIGIARALTLNPDIIVCDEPVSALDVSVQAQVMNLLEEIQDEFGLAYIFVAHDLSVVRHISDRVAVMYLGWFVEIGNESQIYETPIHPYTQALLSAVPIPDPTKRDRTGRIMLTGDVPSPADPPSGCRFRTRCWKAEDICAEEVPELIDRFGHGHPARCHFAEVVQVVPT